MREHGKDIFKYQIKIHRGEAYFSLHSGVFSHVQSLYPGGNMYVATKAGAGVGASKITEIY